MAGIALGFLFLVWAPVEDTDVIYAELLAAGVAAWVAVRYLMIKSPRRAIAAWGLAGLSVAPISVALMSFKSGLHGHGFPDFTPAQAVHALVKTPYWSVAGLLAGWIWEITASRQQDRNENTSADIR
jgi:hypothetical protein